MSVKRNTNTKLWDVYVNTLSRQGERRQKRKHGFEFKADAEAWEREQKTLMKGTVCFDMTVGAFCEKILERVKMEFKHSTFMNYRTTYERNLPNEIKKMKLGEVRVDHIHEYILQRNDITIFTKRRIVKYLKVLFRQAFDDGAIKQNPVASIQVKVPKRRMLSLSRDEAAILLYEAKSQGSKWYPIFAMALKIGARTGELYALKKNDVDLEHKLIQIRASWSKKNGYGPTKTGDDRVVPVSQDLVGLLVELLNANHESEFLLHHHTEWSSGSQSKCLKEFCSSIGITPVRFHDLRATFISLMLLDGASLAEVKAIVGHHSVKTTDGYLRVTGRDLIGTTEKLSLKLPDSGVSRNVVPLSLVKK